MTSIDVSLNAWSLAGLLGLAASFEAAALGPAEVYERVKDSVFVVKTYDARGNQKSLSSAVLLPSGKLATNCHGIASGERFEIGRGHRFVVATRYAGNADKDACLLTSANAGGVPAKLGQASSLRVGMRVFAVGAPQGLELSISEGIVSQLRGGKPPLIQTTAAISPGSSGGGLFDSEGRLVGLTTLFIGGGQSLNFALPVEWLVDLRPVASKPVKGRIQWLDELDETEWAQEAVALAKRRDWQAMLTWVQLWTKERPRSAVAWYKLGNAYGILNRHAESIDACRQALKIDPENANASGQPR